VPFDLTQEEAVAYAVQYGTPAIGALALLFIAWVAAGIISRTVAAAMKRAKLDETLAKFFTKLTRWLVLLVGVVSVLGMFGVETTSFAAVIGAAGLAIGLAFQGSLSNFAAGVMLLVFRPFKVGDTVNIAGNTGKVNEIELFTTAIDTFDNRRFIVPNSEIFGTTIENITFHPTRRADVAVGVDYTADIDQTRELLAAAAASVEFVLEDPPPAIILTGLGDSSVNWSVNSWCETGNFGAVKQGVIRAIKMKLDEAEIGIPYPQMDVHLDPPLTAGMVVRRKDG